MAEAGGIFLQQQVALLYMHFLAVADLDRELALQHKLQAGLLLVVGRCVLGRLVAVRAPADRDIVQGAVEQDVRPPGPADPGGHRRRLLLDHRRPVGDGVQVVDGEGLVVAARRGSQAVHGEGGPRRGQDDQGGEGVKTADAHG